MGGTRQQGEAQAPDIFLKFHNSNFIISLLLYNISIHSINFHTINIIFQYNITIILIS